MFKILNRHNPTTDELLWGGVGYRHNTIIRATNPQPMRQLKQQKERVNYVEQVFFKCMFLGFHFWR